MKQILKSLFLITLVSCLVISSTLAFYHDTETSSNNQFVAGSLDLTVGTRAHYIGMLCNSSGVWENDNSLPVLPEPELIGTACQGTLDLKDLGEGDHFFAINDVKPGDQGQNLIFLRLKDNEGYLRISVTNVSDLENSCTDPESKEDDTCDDSTANAGELADNLLITLWVDVDEDGVYSPAEDLLIFENELASQAVIPGSIFWDTILDGDTVHTLGLSWNIPSTTGNIIQSDSFNFDLVFATEQLRHNLDPFQP